MACSPDPSSTKHGRGHLHWDPNSLPSLTLQATAGWPVLTGSKFTLKPCLRLYRLWGPLCPPEMALDQFSPDAPLLGALLPPPWLLLGLLQGPSSEEAGLAQVHPGCFSSQSSHTPGQSPSQDASYQGHTSLVCISELKTPMSAPGCPHWAVGCCWLGAAAGALS